MAFPGRSSSVAPKLSKRFRCRTLASHPRSVPWILQLRKIHLSWIASPGSIPCHSPSRLTHRSCIDRKHWETGNSVLTLSTGVGACIFPTALHSEPSPRDSQAPLPDSMFPQLRLSSTDSSSTRGSSCSSKGSASGPPAWPLRTACATRRRYVIRPNRSSRGSFPASNETLQSFNRRRHCCCDRMRHPCQRIVPDSLLGSPTTSTQKLRPTGFGCATGQATWICPAQKISPCRSYKPYRSCRRAGSTRSPPPSLPDGDQRGCPFGPLRRDFLRRNSNFFSDSCRICLCLATDQSAALYSAQRISECVGPKCTCLP